MAQRQVGRKTYRSMQGKEIDMDLLRKKNELTPAVGNARVNARGDELGPGGKIIKKREDVVKEYYRTQPVQQVEDRPLPEDVSKPTVEEEKAIPRKKTTRAQQKVQEQEPTSAEQAGWEEDDEGNFIRKGE